MTDENSNYDFIRMANKGKIRNQGLHPDLQSALSFLPELGVGIEVFSGGQPTKAEVAAAAKQGIKLRRTGAENHDHGRAADARFYDLATGRRLDWANPQDRPLFEKVVEMGAARNMHFGAGPGYMEPGSMHVGIGNPRVWGDANDGGSDRAPDWLKTSFARGRANAGTVAPANVSQSALMQGGFDKTGEEYQPRANPPQVPPPSTAPAGTPDNWQPASWMDKAAPTDTFTTPPGANGPAPTWGEVGGAAFRTTLIENSYRWASNSAMKPDMAWLEDTSDTKFSKVFDGLNPDEREWVIGRAVSADSAVELRRQIDRSRADSEVFSRSYSALPMAIAMNILDPVSLAAGGVIGKGVVASSNLLRASTAASRVTRMAEAGIIGLSDAAIASGVQSQVDAEFGVDDFAMNALTGVALGAGIGAFVRGC